MVFSSVAFNLLILTIAFAVGFLIVVLLKPVWKNRKRLRIFPGIVVGLASWIWMYNLGTDVLVVRINSES